MSAPRLFLDLVSPDRTVRLARALGGLLDPGDCVLLAGPVGAGKSFLARHLIQSLQDRPEDVPSPTYTLVQTYETNAGEVWHADLYRLSDPGEIDELGLADAFETAICLVEWPDRLDTLAPADALTLMLDPDDTDENRRRATFAWSAGKWTPKLERLRRD